MFDKAAVDQVINKLHIQPVGKGYIDLICPKENIESFIDEMNALDVRILGFTWWCLYTAEHEACGLGGPKNEYGEGWYSEICMGDVLFFDSNEEIRTFLTTEYPNSANYKPCYHPGFWLLVPTCNKSGGFSKLKQKWQEMRHGRHRPQI